MEDIKFNEILAWQKIMSQQQKAAEKSHKMLKSMKQLKNQLVWQHETYHLKKNNSKFAVVLSAFGCMRYDVVNCRAWAVYLVEQFIRKLVETQ